jgi:prepilin-type processing-associated H-X9-DG protein
MESTDLYRHLNLKDDWDAERNRYAGLFTPYFWQCTNFPYRRPTSTLSPSHHVGITGIGPDAASLPVEDPRAGFFGDERKIGVADLPFGTSTMLVAVETTRVQGSWTAGGEPTSRALLDDSPLNGVDAQFGGLHPGGANALFADGSVRFWRGSLDESLIRRMATIHGREGVEAIPDE